MDKDFKNIKTTSFLAEGTQLNGTLTIKGGIRIDGRLKGELNSESVVFLGPSAKINANIKAEAVISSGRIEGDVYSSHHVQISNPGSVKGAITTRELILEKGVAFDGSCKLIEPE